MKKEHYFSFWLSLEFKIKHQIKINDKVTFNVKILIDVYNCQ